MMNWAGHDEACQTGHGDCRRTVKCVQAWRMCVNEAAVHAVCHIFSLEDTEGILLVDGANAFNSLNRKAALHNMKFICPALATANTYQPPTRMFVSGGGEVLSSEGTTQDDPLGMAMYALAVIPLAGTCQQFCAWWDDLVASGTSFGYYPSEPLQIPVGA